MNKFKKGDKVTIHDFSYSVSVENGKLNNNFHAFHPRCRDKFTVVETDCVFPRTSDHSGTNCNNIVIQSVSTGLVVFIEERFLQSVVYTIVIDGKTVILSHESFLALREQLV